MKPAQYSPPLIQSTSTNALFSIPKIPTPPKPAAAAPKPAFGFPKPANGPPAAPAGGHGHGGHGHGGRR